MRRIAALTALVFVAAAALASCSHHASAHSAPPRQQGADDLAMTSRVAAHLIAAAARINGDVPVSQYAGIDPEGRYYAYDPGTSTYWAAGSLRPRDGSSAAAVSVQDDGSYNIFRRTRGGSWTAFDVGLVGAHGTGCPVEVPESVLHLWRWQQGTCRPAAHG